MVPFVSSVRARVMPLLAALTVCCALPGAALAQGSAPQLPALTEEPPPWRGDVNQEPQPSAQDDPSDGQDDLSAGQDDASGSADGTGGPTAGELPRTGSEPLLLGLSGAALALAGTGLRLRTLDADLY